MASATLEHLIQEIETLDPLQRAELRRRLDAAGDEAMIRRADEHDAEDRFQRHLLAKGMIFRLPDRQAPWAASDEPPLIEIRGEPISETVIRERR